MENREPHRVRSAFDLPTCQRRLRHLRSIAVRNLICQNYCRKDALKLQTYFTLHKNDTSEAFYTSEKITGSLNPSWQSFDISRYADDIDTTAKSVVIKVWYGYLNRFRLLMDVLLHFTGLVFFADKLQQDAMKYVANTLVFGMFDKFFTAPQIQSDVPAQPIYGKSVNKVFLQVEQTSLRNSYTASSLSRIYTILRAIKQTQASVQRVHCSIEDRLLSTQEKSYKLSERESLLLRVNQLKNELAWRTLQLQRDQDELGKEHQSAEDKGQWLLWRQQDLQSDQSRLSESRKNYNQTREKLIKENAQLWIRRKQLICELSTCIYPITENDKHEALICSIPIPNSEEFQGHDDTQLSVALGFCSHLVMMISEILELPLRYQMELRGSRSLIRDHIHNKLVEREREFPLYTKGKEKFQFNYGVFLLNKSISQLRYYCGLGTTDLRLTLQNLKTLLELRLGVKCHGPTIVPNSNVGFYDDRKSNTSKDFERTETHSSINSKGRPSLPDSTDHIFDTMIRGMQLSEKQDDTGSDDRSESAMSNTWSSPNIKHECSELDDTEELFKGTDDTFFKILKPDSKSIFSIGSTVENCASSVDTKSPHNERQNGQTSEYIDHLIEVSNLKLSEDCFLGTKTVSKVESAHAPVDAGDDMIQACGIEGTDLGAMSRKSVTGNAEQTTFKNISTFKTSAFKMLSDLDNGDMAADSIVLGD
ncbi:hypothetical protein ScPMuIL_018357 [Solemya velum]